LEDIIVGTDYTGAAVVETEVFCADGEELYAEPVSDYYHDVDPYKMDYDEYVGDYTEDYDEKLGDYAEDAE